MITKTKIEAKKKETNSIEENRSKRNKRVCNPINYECIRKHYNYIDPRKQKYIKDDPFNYRTLTKPSRRSTPYLAKKYVALLANRLT